jgi:hypothetical protein
MEIETTSEVNEVIPAEVAETAPIETAKPELVGDDSLATETAPLAPPVPEYKPDYSYKVYDTVKEFDPRLRGLIKTKEDETWVRDIVTKADGLEINKRNLEKVQKEHEQMRNEYTPLKRDVDLVLQMKDKKDYGSMFTALGLTKQEIMEFAYKEAQLMELTPQQRAEYDNYNKVQFSQYSLQQQNEDLQKKLGQIELTQRKAELQNALNSTDYGDVAKDFDQRNGPNALYNEVVRRGYFYATVQGIEKSPQEIVSEIINVYGLKREAPKLKPSAPKVDLPVIPNTGSGSIAPVARKPKTVEELRAYAKTLED